MIELDLLLVVRDWSAWCTRRGVVVDAPALIDGKSAGCGLFCIMGGDVGAFLPQGCGVNATAGEGLPADLVGSGGQEFFVSHDGLDAVLQGIK